MIIGYDTKPELQIYQLGASCLEILRDNGGRSIRLLDVFAMLKESETVTMNSFMLTLDWLFLLGAIEIQKGRVVKCF